MYISSNGLDKRTIKQRTFPLYGGVCVEEKL